VVGAVLEQLPGGVRAGADADRFGTDATRRVDVLRCIADHHHATVRNGVAERLGAALGADANQLGPQLVVAAKAAEAEMQREADVLELEARGGFDVAGADAERQPPLAGDGERLGHAAVHLIGFRGRDQELGSKLSQVAYEQRVDEQISGRDADALQRQPRDAAIRAAIEAQKRGGIGAAVLALKGALERAPTDASEADERSVDIEQEDRRASHAACLVRTGRPRHQKLAWGFERFARNRAPLDMKAFLGHSAALGAGLACATLFAVGPARATQATRASLSGSAAATPPAAPARDGYEGPPLLVGGGKKVKLGGYGGIGGGYTRLMGEASGFVSLEGALLFDHRLSLGVAGYAFTRAPAGPLANDGEAQQFGAGYGGLALRYSVFGSLPVYGTFGVVMGVGAVNLRRADGFSYEATWRDGSYQDNRDWQNGRFDPFLFVQPELALNANVTRWLRFGATAGYRFSGGVGRFGLRESDLNGVLLGGNIQLGWF